MMRTNGEVLGYVDEWTCPNQFAGSLINLEPGTTYEFRITVTDPDGVIGESVKTGTITTRDVPRKDHSGATLHVYPSCSGSVQQPCYTNVATAAASASPGDLVLVHNGTYTNGPFNLRGLGGSSFSLPLIIRGESAAGVVFDGGAPVGSNTPLFEVMGSRYLFLEDFTIVNAGLGIRGDDAVGLVVRGVTMREVGGAIAGSTDVGQDQDWYIADNDVQGWNDAWAPYSQKSSINKGTHGIIVTGKGHVLEHNKVSRFYDCLGHADSSALRADKINADWRDPYSRDLDFNNNDLFECVDDGIVLDFAYHNIRVWNNRITSVHSGISLQPLYCGPAIIWQNEIYNIPAGNSFKTHNAPVGFEVYHNSIADASQAWEVSGGWQNARIKNNVWLDNEGGYPTWETGDVEHALTEIDYNALSPAPTLIRWRGASYSSNSAFFSATGYQEHGMITTYADFESCSHPPGESGNPVPGSCNWQLKSGAGVIDKGVVIPGISDSYSGSAPDLGAHEFGSQTPVYGPRFFGGGVPECGEGRVGFLCACGGQNVSSGYCCGGSWQEGVACLSNSDCFDNDPGTRDVCNEPDTCSAYCSNPPVGSEPYNETYTAVENMPLDFFGTMQGTEKSTVISIETLQNAQSARVRIGSVDIDSQAEVGYYINGHGDLDVPPENIRNQRAGSPPVFGEQSMPVSYFVEGSNTITFVFADATGTSGFTITDYEVTIEYAGSGQNATCSDGIQNQGETGVDCGGPCPACPCEYDENKPGDLDCSNKVDIYDLTLVGSSFGCAEGDPCWLEKGKQANGCSMNEEPFRQVDISDLNCVSQNFGNAY
ncbi:hypothetical protein D6783_05300 [Candidatus Woesearchaeota archaeon]|nr:MAG: hypothetical protein D6783_05300 [Candidatus Woesearchaeota archaeon]